VGALEAKKLSMFSRWALERCELFATKNCNSDLQLEAPLPGLTKIRARVKAKQTKLLGKTTGQIGKLADSIKDHLWRYMEKQGGSWEDEQVTVELVSLLVEWRMDFATWQHKTMLPADLP
jgi:hypothetical protein